MFLQYKFICMALDYKNPTRHVYLIDDDEDDRMFFADVLSQIDISIIITEACDGSELMNILAQTRFNCRKWYSWT